MEPTRLAFELTKIPPDCATWTSYFVGSTVGRHKIVDDLHRRHVRDAVCADLRASEATASSYHTHDGGCEQGSEGEGQSTRHEN